MRFLKFLWDILLNAVVSVLAIWVLFVILGIKASAGCYFTHCFMIFSMPRWW